MAKSSTDLVHKEIEYAHLNLDLSKVDFDRLRDPFAGYYDSAQYVDIIKAIREPRNFYFTCKYILNVEPAMIQLVCLEELWRHPFPILMGSRGFSKTYMLAVYSILRMLITQGCKILITSSSFRQAKFVFDYMETIWNNAPVLRDLCGSEGSISHQNDMYVFKMGESRTTAIPTGDGGKIRGLRANYIFAEEFNCLGKNTLVETDKGLFRIEDIQYEDLLVVNKDGMYEKPSRFVTTPEVDVYEVITERGYSFKCSEIHKVLTTTGFKLAKDLTGDDCIISENKYRFPSNIVQHNHYNVDENLAWIMGILTSEGSINSKHSMSDPACIDRVKESLHSINPDYHLTCGSRASYFDIRFKSICNLELREILVDLGLDRTTAHTKKVPWSILQSPRNIVIKFLAGLFEGDGSAFLWNDKDGRNKLGVSYYTVSKQLAQEVQIVLKKLGYLSNIQSRTNHISKNLQYMVRLNGSYAYSFAKELEIKKWQTIIDNCEETPLISKPTINYCPIEHLKVKSVTKLDAKEVLYDLTLPDTHSFYANGMVQHNTLPEELFEVIISGFGASASNPIENIKNSAKIRKMKEKGLWTPEHEKKMTGWQKPNQIILSGTAGYQFQHFCKYWKKYRAIIKSGGNKEVLTKLLGREPGKDFDYRDYCIIRVPIDLVPEGMMDLKNIERSRQTMEKYRFDMEYNCFDESVEVITDKGVRKISDISIGDMVLTHRGRFRPVIHTMNGFHNGKVNIINSYGNNQPIIVTPNHRFYCGDSWQTTEKLSLLTQSTLKELNGSKNLLISDYAKDVLFTNVYGTIYVYPKPSQSVNFVDKHIRYKSCIPNEIPIDYNLGIVFGYYASEGCVGANGKCVTFSLDGHVNESLQSYIFELQEAIEKVFGKKAKIYHTVNNAANVCINSRLVAAFLSSICPGLCYDKVIDPKILYSNTDFMRGFITGYWHGDGSVSYTYKHYPKYSYTIQAGCTNKNLLAQIKNCLSYFGIKSSLLNKKEKDETTIQGRTYNAAPAYNLLVATGSHENILKLINTREDYDYQLDQHQYKITEQKQEDFCGYVYNLEVEEDNSYSLINATVHNSVFPKDSNGFFPRLLVESCVTNQPIMVGNELVQFSHRIYGDPSVKYVMGVDPASESDNFAIVILELQPNHTRVVYCWTIRRKEVIERKEAGITNETNFYAFTARKIRTLMRHFNIIHIALDTQGGGINISEALHDLRTLERDELPLWPLRKEDPLCWPGTKDWGYEDEAGPHIIEMVSMSKVDYVIEANHGLKKDLLNKLLLFPNVDVIQMGLAELSDRSEDRLYDTLQDCIVEIEQLKEELGTITHTSTLTGRDRWDTPEVLLAGNKRIHMRKDRYSALLVANAAARRMTRTSTIDYSQAALGGFANEFKNQSHDDSRLYVGSSWFVEAANSSNLGRYVQR